LAAFADNPVSCCLFIFQHAIVARTHVRFKPAPVAILIWTRWIRESINALLPVAGVGGDVAGARLVNQRGGTGAQAAASMVVDTTVGVATQLIFVVAGVTLLVFRLSEPDAAPATLAVLIVIAVLAAAVAIFARLQHRSMFFRFANLVRLLAPGKWPSDFAGSAQRSMRPSWPHIGAASPCCAPTSCVSSGGVRELLFGLPGLLFGRPSKGAISSAEPRIGRARRV
jgi:hypothetical protein